MAVSRTIVELANDAAYILEDVSQRSARLSRFEAFEDVTDAKFLSEFKDDEYLAALLRVLFDSLDLKTPHSLPPFPWNKG